MFWARLLHDSDFPWSPSLALQLSRVTEAAPSVPARAAGGAPCRRDPTPGHGLRLAGLTGGSGLGWISFS